MKLKKWLLEIATVLTLVAAPLPLLGGTVAADTCGQSPAAQEVLNNLASSEVGPNCGQDRVNNIFQTVVTLLSIIVGVASVVVIIYAGFKYITSAGEANRVSNAKATLLYAIVGLAVAGLAQLLIHFVLFQTGDASQSPPKKGSSSFIQTKRSDMG